MDKKSYSWQRNQLIKFLKNNNNYNFRTGGGVSKSAYLSELQKSKTCVSPFGYGEICYRDFEAILCGCVLIKPDMDHIETYPNVYLKGETYVDIKWNMDDLKEKVEDVIENYDRYIIYVKRSQEIYEKAITDSDRFIRQFESIFN